MMSEESMEESEGASDKEAVVSKGTADKTAAPTASPAAASVNPSTKQNTNEVWHLRNTIAIPATHKSRRKARAARCNACTTTDECNLQCARNVHRWA